MGEEDAGRNSVAALEHEVAVLLRLLTATRPRDPGVAVLDRSAYLILYELEGVDAPMALGALAERLEVDLSTVSRQVAAMEAKELVKHCADPADSRVHRVEATALGRQQFRAMREARLATYARIVKDWTPREREVLAASLLRLNRSIRVYRRSPDEVGPSDPGRRAGSSGC